MNEIILVIILSIPNGMTEVYEYPAAGWTQCIAASEVAKVGENATAFCALKPKTVALPKS